MKNRLNFTKANIEMLEPPQTGRSYYYDEKTPALLVCVTHKGMKTFYRYGRIDWRPARVSLGRFPDITVEEASRAATRISGEVAEGRDPQAARRAARVELTLGAVWDQFRENYAAVRLRPRTRDTYTREWNKHLNQWAGWKLTAISVAKVHELHAGMSEVPYMANRVLALLSRLFGYARKPLGWRAP